MVGRINSLSTTRSSKYRSRKSLPAAESHCLHPVLRFPSLNSERCRSLDGRKLFHRWRICSPSGGGAAADATDSAAHSHRKRSISAKSSFLGRRKSLQEKPASCPSLPKNDERRLGRGRSVGRSRSQTEAENLGMIMPPRGRRHLFRRLDYVPQKETIFSGLLALSLLVMPSKAWSWRMVRTSTSEEYQVTFLSGHSIDMRYLFRRGIPDKCDSPHFT